MRGRIGKRGKTWFYVTDVGHEKDGKRKQQWRGGFATRREAEDELSKITGDVREGTYVAPSKKLWGDAWAEWIEASRMRVRPSTLASYAINGRTHILPVLGGLRLQGVTEGHLDALYATLLQKGLKARTVRYCHTIIRKFLSDMARRRLVQRNVAEFATPPSAQAAKPPEMKTWSREQLGSFLAQVRPDRQYACWLLLATTGMRRGEVLGLRWGDIDFDASRLRIERALIRLKGEITFTSPSPTRAVA